VNVVPSDLKQNRQTLDRIRVVVHNQNAARRGGWS
jgi:hypothetical protein